jgi:hypothetical protein
MVGRQAPFAGYCSDVIHKPHVPGAVLHVLNLTPLRDFER